VAQFGGCFDGFCTDADFNNDDIVDLEDFMILRSNFGFISSAPPVKAESLRATPGLSSLVLMTLCVPVLFRKRSN